MRRSLWGVLSCFFLCGFLIVLSHPAAAVEPAVKCEAGKLKEAGKYGFCRLKANSKAVKKGEVADYTKCTDKFPLKFNALETKAGASVCPSEGDGTSMETRITTDTAEIAALLSGGTVTECGNGVVETGEECDFGDLNGETCTTQGMFGDGLACTPGTCGFDTSGCSATRYEDTGLGTVIDHQTSLEWQKTDTDGGVTDITPTYTWTESDADHTDPDGTVFTEFLAGLNNCGSGDGTTVSGGYGGHCDWRVPQIGELLTIVDCAFGNPCIDQSVFGPTPASSGYWSSSTWLGNEDAAWGVGFTVGSAYLDGKIFIARVRAVRGGS